MKNWLGLGIRAQLSGESRAVMLAASDGLVTEVSVHVERALVPLKTIARWLHWPRVSGLPMEAPVRPPAEPRRVRGASAP